MQLILVFETRASCQSDYIYVKSAIDFFYVERKHKITPIYAKAKSELTNCGKKIKDYVNKYEGDSKVILFADYDKEDDPKKREDKEVLQRNVLRSCLDESRHRGSLLRKKGRGESKRKRSALLLKEKANIPIFQ